MIQMLIGPVAKIASTWVEGRVKKAEAKTRMKVAEAEAKAVIMEKKVTGEIDWDIEMAKSSDGSWKDEWLTVINVWRVRKSFRFLSHTRLRT